MRELVAQVMMTLISRIPSKFHDKFKQCHSDLQYVALVWIYASGDARFEAIGMAAEAGLQLIRGPAARSRSKPTPLAPGVGEGCVRMFKGGPASRGFP